MITVWPFLSRRFVLCYVLLLSLVSLGLAASKFHQTDYKVVLDRMEIVFYNHSYAKNVHGGFSWYNRSQRVINGSFTTLQFVSTDVKLDIQLYKFLSNEYRFFPISLYVNACDQLKLNTLGSKEFLTKFSNLHSCPVKPGFYYVLNGIPDYEQFPPYIPSGKYKAAVKVYHKDDFVTQLDFHAAVETILTKWE